MNIFAEAQNESEGVDPSFMLLGLDVVCFGLAIQERIG